MLTSSPSSLTSTSMDSNSVHAFPESERAAFVRHINHVLAGDPDLVASGVLPLDPHTNDIFHAVKNGVLLCKLLNATVPDTIDMGRVTVDLTRDVKTKLFRILENHRLCLQGATKIGCHLVNISGEDIVQGKPYLVFGLLWQVIRAGLLYHINIRDHPELMRLFSSADEDLRNVPAETLLLRWLNWHLARSGFSGEIKNFGSDLADSRAYLHLLHSLQHAQLVQPNQLQAALAIADDLGRAECMLAYANELDPRSTNLFNKGSGMSALHEELESKNRLLETELKTVSSTAADLSHLVAELRARISDLELENGQLKKQLSERQVAYVSLEQEKTKVSETFSEAVVHWKSAQTQFEKEIQLLQEQVQGTAQSLAKTKKELASERRQAETFGICADSLSGELEGFRSRQEKMEYLIEHLKLERVRSDRHVTRLRLLYKSFPSTEALCKAIYCGESDYYGGSAKENQRLTLERVSADAENRGFLTKKGRESSGWRARYFVIRDNFLFYFKSDTDVRAEARGVIRLDDCVVRYAENPTKTELKDMTILCVEVPDHGHEKDVKSDSKSNKLEFFVAGPPAEIDGWKESIQKASGWWTRKASLQSIKARRVITPPQSGPVISEPSPPAP